MTPREAFYLASKHFGSDLALSKAIGFSPGAIVRAKYKGLTPTMAVNVEIATEGKITRGMLRPDIFGPREGLTLIRNKWSRRNDSLLRDTHP